MKLSPYVMMDASNVSRKHSSTFYACNFGISSGVDDPNCKESNEVSSKLGALVILQGIVPSGMEDIPDVDDKEVSDTIVELKSY